MRIGIARLFLLPFSFIFGHNKYFEAQKLEKNGRYKEACYSYALAILNGGIINEKKVRNKIKDLWSKYGPFNYDEDLKKEISEQGDTQEGCITAGHKAVISIIEESTKQSSRPCLNIPIHDSKFC